MLVKWFALWLAPIFFFFVLSVEHQGAELINNKDDQYVHYVDTIMQSKFNIEKLREGKIDASKKYT